MKKIIKNTLLVSIGVNICLFAVAATLNSAELALLSICSAALCGYGYMDMKGDDK